MGSRSNVEPGEWKGSYEPIVLSEKYMTERDDEIREVDIPERLQVMFYSTYTILLNSYL